MRERHLGLILEWTVLLVVFSIGRAMQKKQEKSGVIAMPFIVHLSLTQTVGLHAISKTDLGIESGTVTCGGLRNATSTHPAAGEGLANHKDDDADEQPAPRLLLTFQLLVFQPFFTLFHFG